MVKYRKYKFLQIQYDLTRYTNKKNLVLWNASLGSFLSPRNKIVMLDINGNEKALSFMLKVYGNTQLSMFYIFYSSSN